jgi:hypothetical protein
MSWINSQKLKQEIKVWIQCFLVSTMAAFFAYDYLITQLEGPLNNGMEIGLFGLLRKMWSLFLQPWIITFSLLSIARFFLIFAIDNIATFRKKS